MASRLILSEEFTKIVHYLQDISLVSYLEEFLTILFEQYLPGEEEHFRYAKSADKAFVAANLAHVIEVGEFIPRDVHCMDAEELNNSVVKYLLEVRDGKDRFQFQAAKAFNGYVDELIESGRRKAEKEFEMRKHLI